MFPNKYAGNCSSCGVHVPPSQGFYDYGNVWCSDTSYVSVSDGAPAWAVRYVWARVSSDGFRNATAPIATRDEVESVFARFVSVRGDGVSTVEACSVTSAWLLSDEMRVSRDGEIAQRLAVLAEEDARILAQLRAEWDELVILSRVRSITQVIEKVLGAPVAVDDMTGAQMSHVVAELESRIVRRENRGVCRKCNGTGEYWRASYSGTWFDDKCYPCAGTGRIVRTS